MALTGLQFLVVVLAAYRAARLLTKDDIFETPRARIEEWSLRHANREHYVRGKIGDLISCPYCLGMYLSWIGYTVAVFAWHGYGRVGLWAHFITAWAVAGGQALLNAFDAWMEQTNKAATEVADG